MRIPPGTKDEEWQEERTDRRSKDCEPDENDGDPEAQRYSCEGGNADFILREGHHGRHCSRSRDPSSEGARNNRSAYQSPQEERRVHRSANNRR